MNIFDAIIILSLIGMVIRGYRIGILQQAFSGGGFIGGLLMGSWLASALPSQEMAASQKFTITVLLLLACASFGLIAGEYVGLVLARKLNKPLVKRIDGILGAVLSGVALVVILWLSAPLLQRLPDPEIRALARSSSLIKNLQSAVPSAPSYIAKLGQLIDSSKFPQVFMGDEPKIDTNTPLPDLGSLNEGVEKNRVSAVRLEGAGCGGIVEGSGFIAKKNLVVTNAHVVAGVKEPTIVDANGRHTATAVWFDPDLDVAVLKTSDLAGDPMRINTAIVERNTPAATLGYPGGGDFAALPTVIIEHFIATGRNIYNQESTSRSVYSIKADVNPGTSGGPIVDANGDVIALVFAESTEYNDIGYALTMDQVKAAIEKAENNEPVSTSKCVH